MTQPNPPFATHEPTIRPHQGILWNQVLGLATLQGTITLTWLIYNLYLSKLLVQVGLPASWSIGVLLVENLMSIFLEPWMGGWSDRTNRWFGIDFPFLPIGAGLAGLIFGALPLVAAQGTQSPPWLLPTCLISWAIAMALFRSPALALLRQLAPKDEALPQAASVLTLFSAVVSGIGIYTQPWLVSQGPAFAFGLGSVVLLAAAVGLRWIYQSPRLANLETVAAVIPEVGMTGVMSMGDHRSQVISYGWLLLLGLSSGLGNSALRDWLKLMSPDKGLTSVLVLFTVTHILTILPAGKIATALGNRVTTGFGLGLATVGLATGWLTGSGLGGPIAILLGVAASCLLNGLLPFVLSYMPADRAGLGVGLFFGGAALAGSLLNALGQWLTPVPIGVSLGLGTLGFVITGCCLIAAPSRCKARLIF
jgi:Na+/melibiose symporter-like transporter